MCTGLVHERQGAADQNGSKEKGCLKVMKHMSSQEDLAEQLSYLFNCIKKWWEDDVNLGYIGSESISLDGNIFLELQICITPDAKIMTRSLWDILPSDSHGFQSLTDTPENKKKLHALIEERFPSASIRKVNITYQVEHKEYYIENLMIVIEEYRDILQKEATI